MKRILSTFFFVVCPILAFFLLDTAHAADGDYEQLFDALEKRVEDVGHLGDGPVTGCPAYLAILESSVPILEPLAKRMAVADDFILLNAYTALFGAITQFQGYPYAREHLVHGGLDFYESNRDDLPSFSYDMTKSYPNCYESREKLLECWRKREEFPPIEQRITLMRECKGPGGPADAAIALQDYRRYQRALINYGIFNLPVYITLIREDNNVLAFSEFLHVTRHPVLDKLKSSFNVFDNLKQVATTWPSHEERMLLVKKWWEAEGEKYKTLPTLAKAIEEAAEKL